MRIPSGTTDQYIYFVAVDATDLKTRETGLSSFTVYRSRNGAAAAAMTTPTINETDATNMPGVYELLLDEDMTIGAGNDSEEMVFHITATGMAPVTRTIELYRREVTGGETLTVASGVGEASVQSIAANAITATAIASNAITSAKIATDAIGAAQIAADAIGASELAADAVAEIADAVWDEAQSGHVTAGSFGEIATEIADILVDTAEIGTAGAGLTEAGGTGDHLTAVPWNAAWDAEVESEANDALVALGLDHLVSVAVVGTDVADNSIAAKLVSASATADWDDFVNTTDSLQAIRDRGDAAWTTGGGGSISDILNIVPLLPPDIDLANTATYRLGLMLTNAVDDLPSTAEITPGTISIERKAIGGTSWSAVVTDAACSELAGMVYYDEVFDSATGYAEGDSIRLTFKSQKITVSANDYEISDTNGRIFYTSIRQTMRGTDSAYTGTPPTAAAIADAVLDEALSGHATAGSLGKAVADIETDVTAILADTNELQTDDVPGLIASLNDPTAAAIADAVWDELQSGHVTAGSFGEIATEIAAILADTNELQTDDVPGLIAALNDISAAQVNAEVVDALNVDTYAEPGQGAPAATASLAAKIGYLYKSWRNKKEQTSTTFSLYNDAGTTVDQKSTVSDDGTTATRGEIVTGP